ncbi:tripartite tricarboxylate transporter substrate binding protein [Limnohabitans sp. Hippo4]|uniref:Bug family tripartite tricarboxylate transporter substrate binding protein n=1 Tax=Limnohabitans sp. Hippo4 TaxID=1826167 RepID=UPI000D3692E0|nr:tripartite tricarboxylate transporter substrate binding protein [Limnohabitans sp. Hippo4]MBU3723201.1 tripartite tricarboxylate transporter substrate binding protein [Limnohabitans sp.]PUE37400.1 MFS transporter [Limnohabitans sp. Hippo4]
MKKLLSIVCAATCLTLSAGQAVAQAYPTKPIKIIVPFGPGGFTDVVARILGVKLGESLGQSVVIENKPGAGSMIGTDQVAKSAPDGHTLLIVSSTHVISPWIYKSVPYDPIKSFAPVTKLVDSPYVLLTNPKVPAKNVQEFIALAKANPDKIHFASSGNGSAQHLIGGMFASMTKTQLKHVPYRSSNLATTDVVAGVVESSFAGVPNALSQVPNGRLNALAVTSAKRIPQLPNVPTMQEAGVPGYDATIWLALLAPAGTPAHIVNKLNAEVAKIMNTAETNKAMFEAGVEVSLSTPEALTQLMTSEMSKWGKVVKDAGIKLE